MTGPGIAHDGSTLVFGTWVCDCPECLEAVRSARPTLPLVLKGYRGRAIVSGAEFVRLGVDVLARLHGIGEVREVFVARTAGVE